MAKPLFSLATNASITSGEEEEDDDTSNKGEENEESDDSFEKEVAARPKGVGSLGSGLDSPSFSLSQGPAVQHAVSVTSGEEDDEEEVKQPKTFVAPTVKTATIFEGEEDEEDVPSIPSPPVETSTAPQAPAAQAKEEVPKSAAEMKIRASNENVRKFLSKKLVTVFEGVRKELHATSDSLNGAVRTSQGLYDMATGYNARLESLSTKLSQIELPLKF